MIRPLGFPQMLMFVMFRGRFVLDVLGKSINKQTTVLSIGHTVATTPVKLTG